MTQIRYLVADYERSSFSIHQRKWDANAKTDVQTILPPSATTSDEGGTAPKSKSTDTSHTHTSIAVIIASVIGGVVLLIVVVGCIIIVRQRSRKLKALNSQTPPTKEAETKRPPVQPYSDMISPASTLRTELDATETLKRSPELDATSVPMLPGLVRVPPAEERIYELPASGTTIAELIGSPIHDNPLWRRQREIEENR